MKQLKIHQGDGVPECETAIESLKDDVMNLQIQLAKVQGKEDDFALGERRMHEAIFDDLRSLNKDVNDLSKDSLKHDDDIESHRGEIQLINASLAVHEDSINAVKQEGEEEKEHREISEAAIDDLKDKVLDLQLKLKIYDSTP